MTNVTNASPQEELNQALDAQSPDAAIFAKDYTIGLVRRWTPLGISNLTLTASRAQQRLTKYENREADVQEWFTDNADSYGEESWFSELARLLGVKVTKRVSVTVEATFDLVLEVPIGFDPDELGESDFSVSIDYNGDGEMVEDRLDNLSVS